jgi:hypothetical protein
MTSVGLSLVAYLAWLWYVTFGWTLGSTLELEETSVLRLTLVRHASVVSFFET